MPERDPGAAPSVRTRVFAGVALLAIVLHAAVYVSLHVLEPSLGLTDGLFTDYLRTDFAVLARLGFVLFGVTWLALALALGEVLPRGVASILVVAFLLCAAASLVYSATLDADAADPRLAAGPSVLRGVLGIFRLGLFASLVIASVTLRSVPGWSPLAGFLTVLATVNLVVLLLSLVVLLDRGVAGVGQRLVFLLTYAWGIAVTMRILSSPMENE